MQTRAVFLLMAAIVAATLYIVFTIDALPPRVATHFGAGGQANGWMDRSAYLPFVLVLLNVLPLLQLLFVGIVPRRFPRTLNIPARNYWLDPARRAQSYRFLWVHACSLGILCVLLVSLMHHVLVVANRGTPPSLPAPLFVSVLGGFLLLVVVWVLALYRRFRKPAQ